MDSSVMMADLDAFKHLPYFKPLYTTIIKLQMQYLVEQLSENADEETLLLTTNPSSGTVSKLTSLHASGFLDQRSDIKAQFTKYCYESKQLTENSRKRKHSKDSAIVIKKSKYIARRHDNGTAYLNTNVFTRSEKITNPGIKFKKHWETNISLGGNDTSISNIEISGVKSLVSDKTNKEDGPSDSAGQKSNQHVTELSAATEDLDLAIVKKELDSEMDSVDKFGSRSGNEDNVEEEDVDSDLRKKTNDEIADDNHVADEEMTSFKTDNIEDSNDATNVDTNNTRLDKKQRYVRIPIFSDDWTIQQSDMDSDSMIDSHENSETYRSLNNSQNSHSDNISDISLNSPVPFSERTFSHQSAGYQSQSDVLLTNAVGRFECSYCEQSFTTVSSKRRHERKHTGENPFACDLCDQKFYRKDDLNVHIYKHKGYKPYSCHICQAGYVKRKMLEWHLASAHNVTVSNTLP